MQFPLGLYELSIWLAISAIILLVTSEFISSQYGQTDLIIEKSRIKIASLILGFLLLFTFAIRIYQIIITL